MEDPELLRQAQQLMHARARAESLARRDGKERL
jgi:hypothetical protein